MKDAVVKFFKKYTEGLRAKFPIKVQRVTPPPFLTEQDDWDKKLVFSLAKQRFPTWQQLQHLPRYLSKKEQIIIRLLLALVLASMAFLVVRFYLRHVVYLPKQGGSYTEALVGKPSYLNPVLAQKDVDLDICRLVYSGLFKYNEKLELVPDLAERFEISDDKKTYTIYLRPDLTWQNGNALLADDVVYTFETIKDPEYSSPYYASFKGSTVERIDDRTVSFTLPNAFAPFLSNLTVGLLPAHLWSDLSASSFRLSEYNTKPIGSGPYTFKELVKDRDGNIKSYVLTRNQQFAGVAPNVDKITFKFYADFESALAAVKSKSVDGVSYVPKEFHEAVIKDKATTIYSLHLPQYTAIFLNQRSAIFKDKNLRQALAYATDRQTIFNEAIHNDGRLVSAPILEGFNGYNPDIKQYGFDQAKARELLDTAGWKVPAEGGLRQKSGQELKVSLTTVDQADYLKVADTIKQNWEAVGVGVELKIMNSSRVDKEVIKPRNYEAFLYGEILGADPDPYPFWHSSQSTGNGLNLSNYYNKEADKLLEAARQTESSADRAKQYIDFQNILVEDMPAVFLYSPSYDYAISKRIRGFITDRITVPADRFDGIEGWYINTKHGWK